MKFLQLSLLWYFVSGITSETLDNDTSSFIVTKIVGGSDASPGEFPYQVSLQRSSSSRPSYHYCGATIYSEKFVITAHHCVSHFNSNNPRGLKAVAGELEFDKRSGHEQTRRVVRIIKHPRFNTRTFENDVALLEVARPFNLTNFIAPLPLQLPGQSLPATCVVSGWGTTQHGEYAFPKILQKVSVPLVSDEACSNYYSNYTLHPTSSMICAGDTDLDSCQGDSGGPLQCNGYLTGIVSWGIGCGVEHLPGVYTEVSHFVSWITENAIASGDN